MRRDSNTASERSLIWSRFKVEIIPKPTSSKLVRDWLRSVKNRRWILVLDNVDDASFLLKPGYSNPGIQESRNTSNTLYEYLPLCAHGSILITTRSKEAARKLVEHLDMISVRAMQDGDAVRLLGQKLRNRVDLTDVLDLAQELENMPLALTQAAAYLGQMRSRCSVRKYIAKIRKSNKIEENHSR